MAIFWKRRRLVQRLTFNGHRSHLKRCFRRMSCCRWRLVRPQRFKTEEKGEVRKGWDMLSPDGRKHSRGFCSLVFSRVQARRRRRLQLMNTFISDGWLVGSIYACFCLSMLPDATECHAEIPAEQVTSKKVSNDGPYATMLRERVLFPHGRSASRTCLDILACHKLL